MSRYWRDVALPDAERIEAVDVKKIKIEQPANLALADVAASQTTTCEIKLSNANTLSDFSAYVKTQPKEAVRLLIAKIEQLLEEASLSAGFEGIFNNLQTVNFKKPICSTQMFCLHVFHFVIFY